MKTIILQVTASVIVIGTLLTGFHFMIEDAKKRNPRTIVEGTTFLIEGRDSRYSITRSELPDGTVCYISSYGLWCREGKKD